MLKRAPGICPLMYTPGYRVSSLFCFYVMQIYYMVKLLCQDFSIIIKKFLPNAIFLPLFLLIKKIREVFLPDHVDFIFYYPIIRYIVL